MFRRHRPLPFHRSARIISEQVRAGANKLFERGLYPEAALIFERLVGEARMRGGPRSPHFYLEAGNKWGYAGIIHPGMAQMAEGHRLA